MEEYYAHTIRIKDIDSNLERLEQILKSGYLLSRRNLGLDSVEDSLYNGLDYISLCDLSKNHNGYSSYNMYVRNGLSLLLDHNINVITPTLLDYSIYTYMDVKNLDLVHNRYSDFKDEVQVKNRISLEYLKGLCIPVSMFYAMGDSNCLNNYVKRVYELLEKYNYSVPLYNIDSEEVIKIKK